MKQLIITEKKSVGEFIAKLLGVKENKGGYLENQEYVISWAQGHLVHLGMPDIQDKKWKEWKLSLLPVIPSEWKYVIGKETKRQFDVLKMLINRKDIECVINAGDAGREGEYIQRLIYAKAGNRHPVKRLWMDSNTEATFWKAWKDMRSESEFDGLYDAAQARAFADAMVGWSFSRLLAITYHVQRMSIGRVQTAVLGMVNQRDRQIEEFEPEPFYQVTTTLADSFTGVWFDEEKDRFMRREDAEKVAERVKGGEASVRQCEAKKKRKSPPRLYSQNTLQADGIRIFGYRADEVLAITQALYDTHKITTYPRTDSEYITSDMEDGMKQRIRDILGKEEYREYASLYAPGMPDVSRCINDKKVGDHHAIVVNENYADYDMSRLSGKERNILGLIAARMLEAVGSDYVYNETNVVYEVFGEKFHSVFKMPVEQGYLAVHNKLFEVKESKGKQVPSGISVGSRFPVLQAEVIDKMTSPPKPYRQDLLVLAMEDISRILTEPKLKAAMKEKGLGTGATRAGILKELFDKEYLVLGKGKNPPVHVSDLGHKIVLAAPKELITPVMAANWEYDLQQIEKGEYTAEQFLRETEQYVTGVCRDYKPIPEDFSMYQKKKEESRLIGKCPKCGEDFMYGKFGGYCRGTCGFILRQFQGKQLTESELGQLLRGERTLVTGIKSKKSGKKYSMYVKPVSISEFHYTREGKEGSGWGYEYETEFKDKLKR